MNGSFSFIHAADLHLDSPFRGFALIDSVDKETKENILSKLRDCTFTALENIVSACLRNKVDFLVLAGDIYDLADPSLRAQLRFRQALERLAEAGIKVYVAYGNHDHHEGWRAELTWPDNVCFFPAGEVSAQPVLRDGREIARIYGISYPRRDVSENYALRFKRDPDAPFALGVLHCNVGGNLEHANYAPCNLQELVGGGFDYWALGHVHGRSLLREQKPCIVYPGNPQGRNPREAGVKGCYLVKVTNGSKVKLDFLATDCVRWERAAESIEYIATEEELLQRLSHKLINIQEYNGGRSVIARIELCGRGEMHRQLQRSGILEGILEELRYRFARPAGNFIWPESVVVNTGALLDKESLRESETLLGDLLTISREARHNEDLRHRLLQLLEPLNSRASRYFNLTGDEDIDALLEAAENMALDLLWEGEKL